jgi:hypothetical protein
MIGAHSCQYPLAMRRIVNGLLVREGLVLLAKRAPQRAAYSYCVIHVRDFFELVEVWCSMGID